jgi:hypothetical protein
VLKLLEYFGGILNANTELDFRVDILQNIDNEIIKKQEQGSCRTECLERVSKIAF